MEGVGAAELLFTWLLGSSLSPGRSRAPVRAPGSPVVRRQARVWNDCEYQRALLAHAFGARTDAWDVGAHVDPLSDTCVLQVDEYENLVWERILQPPFLVANAYCVRKGLIRKGDLARHAENFANKQRARATAARGEDRGSGTDGRGPDRVSTALWTLEDVLPRAVVVNTWDAFRGDSRVDRESALADCLWEADEEIECGGVDVASGSPPQTAAGDRQRLWILKPSLANRAAGLFLVRNVDEVREAVSEDPDAVEWVLQRYVERPLLVGRRKFHLRVYVLAVGALSVFVFREALVLIAVPKFPEARGGATGLSGEADGDGDAPVDMGPHITNTCFNSDHPKFDEAQFVRLFSELPDLLDQSARRQARRSGGAVTTEAESLPGRERVARIYAGIRAAVARTFASFAGEFSTFMPLPNAFELFGVDFVVDEDLRPWLLEFNPGPDLKQTGERLRGFMNRMVSDMVGVAVDARDWSDPARRIRRHVDLARETESGASVVTGEATATTMMATTTTTTTTTTTAVCEGWVPDSLPCGHFSVDASPASLNGWDCVYERLGSSAVQGGASMRVDG